MTAREPAVIDIHALAKDLGAHDRTHGAVEQIEGVQTVRFVCAST